MTAAEAGGSRSANRIEEVRRKLCAVALIGRIANCDDPSIVALVGWEAHERLRGWSQKFAAKIALASSVERGNTVLTIMAVDSLGGLADETLVAAVDRVGEARTLDGE